MKLLSKNDVLYKRPLFQNHYYLKGYDFGINGENCLDLIENIHFLKRRMGMLIGYSYEMNDCIDVIDNIVL